MNWSLKVFFLSVIFLIAGTGQSQPDLARYRFEHITVNDGLAHSDAMCVEQDAEGFIWIGTNDGINRYDGYKLQKYSLPINTRSGLSGNRIRDLYNDGKNRLWVGAEGAGLSLFDPNHDRFINVDKLVHPTRSQASIERLQLADVEVITADLMGGIWVGTRSNGLFVITLNKANHITDIRQIALSDSSSVWYGVSSLALDRDGTLWIGTISKGLWSVATGQLSLPSVAQITSFKPQFIRALCLDSQDNLWIGSDQHIVWISAAERKARQTFLVHSLPQYIKEIQCIYFDSFGHLWVGTNSGLFLWESYLLTNATDRISIQPEKYQIFLPSDLDVQGINSARVEQIFEDKNQILWLSTPAGGLNKLDLHGKPFTNLQRRAAESLSVCDNAD